MQNSTVQPKKIRVIVIVSIVLVLLLITAFSSIKTIDSGTVGVVSVFGAVKDEPIYEGLHTVVPFVTNVTKMNTKTQKVEALSAAASRDLQNISTTIASVLLGRPPADVTGRGAGLSDDALERKIKVIQKAIDVNAPDPSDALDVLAKLGGFDIAGLAGIFIGGALYRIPIIVDGIISAVSAMVAARLCPACQNAMLASHMSREPSARMLLDELSLKPLITAEMSLGEGTGAVAILPLLDLALAVYHGSSSFSDIGIDAYTPQ